MIIKGEIETYNVFCREYGFSAGIPVIQAKRRHFFFFERWVTIKQWVPAYRTNIEIQRMTYDQMKAWFIDAVTEFEEVKLSFIHAEKLEKETEEV